MLAKKISENTWIIRLFRGEELLTELRGLCGRENIRLGYFTGLGAVKEVELGIYLPDEKKFAAKTFAGTFEVVSLHGNITTLDDEIYFHTHIGVSDEELEMFGGHLYRGVIGPTAEIFLHVYDGTVSRSKDEQTGLNGLNLYHSAGRIPKKVLRQLTAASENSRLPDCLP